MASCYAVATGAWNSTGTWSATDGGSSGAAAPTASDDAFLTATSGNINVTISATAACRSLICTGYTGTLTHNVGTNFNIGTSSIPASSDVLLLVGTMTYTIGGGPINLVGTTTGGKITTGGVPMPSCSFNGVGGGWILQDNFTCASSRSIGLTRGDLNFNGKTVTIDNMSSTGTTTRSLTLGAATVNLFGTSTIWDFTDPTALTFSGASGTINSTNTSSTARTFKGGGQTFGTLTYLSTGTGTFTITGANTFGTLNINNMASSTLNLPTNTTQTITSSLIIRGQGYGSLLSSSAATPATISVGSGLPILLESITVQDITGTGGGSFLVINSKNVSGNTGLTFIKQGRGWGL